MPTLLAGLAGEIRRIVNVIASVTSLDAVVLDETLDIVASSGGVDRWKIVRFYGAAEVLRTGLPLIIDRPGSHVFCSGCPLRRDCPEKADVNVPIKVGGQCVGVLAVAAFDDGQKESILAKAQPLSELLAVLAVLLEPHLSGRGTVWEVNEQLSSVLEWLPDALILVDSGGALRYANQRAEKAVLRRGRSAVVGCQASEVLGGRFAVAARFTIRHEETMTVLGDAADHVVRVFPVPGRRGHAELAGLSYVDVKSLRGGVAQDGEPSREPADALAGIVGTGASLARAKELAARLARSDCPVLVTGETGTGKELFARAIHQGSARTAGPFRAVSCAAIPDALLESELFGYEEGAFTGARKRGKPGKFELASGGTLFLDEVGDMPLHLQAKLLRALEGSVVEKLGGTRPVPVDVRIIAASNRDLAGMVESGGFRADLFYRLNVLRLHLPPLRERKEDIPALLQHFVAKLGADKGVLGISPEAAELLVSYSWPGNVRELRNVVQHATELARGPLIGLSDLPEQVLSSARPTPESQVRKLRDVEKEMIREALRVYGRSVVGKSLAAKALGIDLSTLYRKVSKYGIP